MRKAPMLIGILLVFGFLSADSLAQLRKKNWEIGGYVGQGFFATELELNDENLFGLRVAYSITKWLGVEVSFDRSSTEVDTAGSTLLSLGPLPGEEFSMDVDTFKVDFVINAASGLRRWRGYALVGLGRIDFNENQDFIPGVVQPGNTSSSIFDIGGGARWFLTDLISFRADLRLEYALGDAFSNLKPTVGVSFHLGGEGARDLDADGVSDVKDECADTPSGATVDIHGCTSDSDNDKALDGLDQCPGTPEGWPVDDVGCPTDADGDEVPDGADQCADTPEGARVDDQGCPLDTDKDEIFDGLDECEGTIEGAVVDGVGCPIDSDKDGVFDGIDQCEDTPTRVVVDTVGCPVDSDKDGIFDGLDQCPGSVPGTRVDETGCPRIRPAVGEKLILEGVVFDPGSDILARDSYPVLDEVLITMQYYDDWKFEIQGHTDSDGMVDANQSLSDRRARSILRWFLDNGIDPERLTSKGFGESTPLTDNLTDIGKTRNRRVELLRTQ